METQNSKLKTQNHSLKFKALKFLFAFFTFYFFIFPFYCFAGPISSVELIERAKEYDNKTIEYQGEVVGDVMKRGDFVWINLHDGKNAIGVFGKFDAIGGLIEHKGGYTQKGDILSVEGVFHRACPDHGGDLDIHLIRASKIKGGHIVRHEVALWKVIDAAGLFIVAAGLAMLCAIRKKKK